MKTLFFALALIFTLISYSCRYENNENLNLLTAKNRLLKDWQLDEFSYLDDNTEKSLSPLSFEFSIYQIRFSHLKQDTIVLEYVSTYTKFKCLLKANKTKIFIGLGDDYWLIKRLTNKQLWIEANKLRFVDEEGKLVTKKVLLKYEEK